MKTKIAVWIAWLLLIGYVLMAAPPVQEGKSIFMTRCAACHNVNKQVIGPALNDIDKKRSTEWIISFIHSSQTMVKNGDKDAVAVFEQFNKIPMPDHTDLREDQIKNIIEFIKSESKEVAVTTPYIPGKKKTANLPLTLKDYGFMAGFMIVVAMLMTALYFAVHSKTIERRLRDKSVPS